MNLKAKAIPNVLDIFNSMVGIFNLKFLGSKKIYLQLDFTLEPSYASQKFMKNWGRGGFLLSFIAFFLDLSKIYRNFQRKIKI